MTAKRPIAYITAAWSGNRTADRERAAQYCRQVYEAGYSPLCPMLFLPVFLHESIPKEHKDGLDIPGSTIKGATSIITGRNVTWTRKAFPISCAAGLA